MAVAAGILKSAFSPKGKCPWPKTILTVHWETSYTTSGQNLREIDF